MTRLKLEPLETGSDYVENPKFYVSSIDEKLGGNICVELRKKHIKCENKDEVFDAIHRRSKRHFEGVKHRNDNCLIISIDVDQTFWSGRFTVSSLGRAQQRAEDAMKNTIEDVFGVGCVEAECCD